MSIQGQAKKYTIVNGKWILQATDSQNPINSYRAVKIDEIKMIHADKLRNTIELAVSENISVKFEYTANEKEQLEKDLKIFEDLIYR